MTMTPLHVDVPTETYHQNLISCQVACPVHTDARGYVRLIAEGRFEEAYLVARGPNPFASICGRVCGAPCEAACRRGKVPRVDDDGAFVANDRPISIRALNRFVCEQYGPEKRGPGCEGMREPPGGDYRRRHRTAADVGEPTATIGNAAVSVSFCRVRGVARPSTDSQRLPTISGD